MFGEDGTVMPNGSIAGRKQNWTGMTLIHTATEGDVTRDIFVPGAMMDVSPAAWKFRDSDLSVGENPFVRGDRLTELGISKNPGF
jgi:hypothetical protein